MPTPVKQLRESTAIKQFLLAGKAEFTLVSRKTDKHLAFRVRYIAHTAPSRYFVNAGIGWGCIGTLEDLKFTPRYGMGEDSQYILAFKWWLKHLADEQVEIWHVGKCGMCNRPLTDPISIARGIGPECAQKLASKQDVAELFA